MGQPMQLPGSPLGGGTEGSFSAPTLGPSAFGTGNILQQGREIKTYPTLSTPHAMRQVLGSTPNPVHALIYGHSGSQKSLMARTFPTPWLVLGWDPYDNMRTYADGLVTQDGVDTSFGQGYPIEYTACWTPEGEFVGRIEHYSEPMPEQPRAYATWFSRAPFFTLAALTPTLGWTPKTVIWDSLTYSTYAAVLYHMAMHRDQSVFKMSGHAKTSMIRDILSRLAWMRCNVVVIAHLAKPEEKEEYNTGMVRGISAIGTLGTELPTGFGEVYRAHMINRPGQPVECWLQTEGDSLYFAKSISRVPNPCQPHYLALWDSRDAVPRDR